MCLTDTKAAYGFCKVHKYTIIRRSHQNSKTIILKSCKKWFDSQELTVSQINFNSGTTETQVKNKTAFPGDVLDKFRKSVVETGQSVPCDTGRDKPLPLVSLPHIPVMPLHGSDSTDLRTDEAASLSYWFLQTLYQGDPHPTTRVDISQEEGAKGGGSSKPVPEIQRGSK